MTDNTPLARQLWPELKTLAHNNGFRVVTRLALVVGAMHGVSEARLAADLQKVFEGTGFDGAVVDVTLVKPLEPVKSPLRSDTTPASGWELLVTRIEGEK